MTDGKTEQEDPLDELARENETIEQLGERLAEIAIALNDGREVPPGEIAEGLRLYEQYLRIHARRFDENLQPEARPVAMSNCFEHLDSVHADRSSLSERVEQVRQAIEAYAQGGAESRTRLAKVLEAFALHEYDAVQHENNYPLSCLRAALPDEATDRIRAGFDRTVAEIHDLERHATDYLHRSLGKASIRFGVKCREPRCDQKAEAESFPAEGGHLGIRGPDGWSVVASHPQVRSRGESMSLAVDVDFWCPTHAPKAIASEKSPGELSTDTEDVGLSRLGAPRSSPQLME